MLAPGRAVIDVDHAVSLRHLLAKKPGESFDESRAAVSPGAP